MGTSTSAKIVYGVKFTWDDLLDALTENLDDEIEDGQIDNLFESIRAKYPLIEIISFGDSVYWDESMFDYMIQARRLEITSDGALTPISVQWLEPPDRQTEYQLVQAAQELGLINDPGWFLGWTRG